MAGEVPTNILDLCLFDSACRGDDLISSPPRHMKWVTVPDIPGSRRSMGGRSSNRKDGNTSAGGKESPDAWGHANVGSTAGLSASAAPPHLIFLFLAPWTICLWRSPCKPPRHPLYRPIRAGLDDVGGVLLSRETFARTMGGERCDWTCDDDGRSTVTLPVYDRHVVMTILMIEDRRVRRSPFKACRDDIIDGGTTASAVGPAVVRCYRCASFPRSTIRQSRLNRHVSNRKALSLLQERISSCLGIRQAVAVPGKRIKVTKLPVGVQTGLSSSRGSTYYIHFHQKLFLQDLVLVFGDCYSRSRSFHTVMTLPKSHLDRQAHDDGVSNNDSTKSHLSLPRLSGVNWSFPLCQTAAGRPGDFFGSAEYIPMYIKNPRRTWLTYQPYIRDCDSVKRCTILAPSLKHKEQPSQFSHVLNTSNALLSLPSSLEKVENSMGRVKKKKGRHVEYHGPKTRPPFRILIQLNNHRRSRSRPLRAPSTPTRPCPVLALQTRTSDPAHHLLLNLPMPLRRDEDGARRRGGRRRDRWDSASRREGGEVEGVAVAAVGAADGEGEDLVGGDGIEEGDCFSLDPFGVVERDFLITLFGDCLNNFNTHREVEGALVLATTIQVDFQGVLAFSHVLGYIDRQVSTKVQFLSRLQRLAIELEIRRFRPVTVRRHPSRKVRKPNKYETSSSCLLARV
ncbi:hypothetical protein KC361_g3 [Hortaea werneckii]|nr:hypothetical protein KC361_g3 [Hortaea werneckii]